MFIYFSLVLHFVFFTLTVVLMMLLRFNREKLESAQHLNEENASKIEQLTQEKILQAEKLQHLNSKLQIAEETLKQMDKIQASLMQSAENTLKNLGSDLTKQLLAAHQHETKNAQIQHDQKITKAAGEIRTEVQKLVSSIKVLEKEVEESSASVKMIKNSLLSPVQASNLTEITLSNILIKSGLTPELDFKLQPTIIKGEKSYRPDAIVFLPNSEFIIIDAKASKFFIEESDKAENLQSTSEQNSQMHENLIKSMNRHLKDLSEKDYELALKHHLGLEGNSNFHSVTIMFLHTESIVEKISSVDKSFLSKAWEKNIFPVGPSGLMNILSLTKRQIRTYRQIENYTKILHLVQRLIASVEILTVHGNKLGADLYSLTNSYDKFAASFNQNFVSKAKSLHSLGISSQKNQHNNSLKRYLISPTHADFEDTKETD